MKIESHMVRSAPPYPSLPSTYDDFLYAPVGEDRNGACLTVLSMLARRNVDPWEEAADLSRLPRDSARQKLVSMITASSDQPSATAELRAVADRVVAVRRNRANLGDHVAGHRLGARRVPGCTAAGAAPRPFRMVAYRDLHWPGVLRPMDSGQCLRTIAGGPRFYGIGSAEWRDTSINDGEKPTDRDPSIDRNGGPRRG